MYINDREIFQMQAQKQRWIDKVGRCKALKYLRCTYSAGCIY